MKTPFPHQVALARFVTDGGTFMAAAPGCGKTYSAIMACEALMAENILIACPSIMPTTWQIEFEDAGLAHLGFADARRHPKKVAGAGVVTVSHGWARYPTAQEIMRSRRWDVLVVDEAHFLGSPDSARTQAVYRDTVHADKVILLSGTPTPTHAGQLWAHIRRTAWDRIDRMAYDTFCDRYCTVQMRVFPGMRRAQRYIAGTRPEMITDLRQRLAGWWMRVRLQDVIKDLPPKLHQTVRVPMNRLDLSKIEAEVDPEVFEAIEFAAEIGDVSGLARMSEGVATLRRLLAAAKVEPTVDYVLGLRELSDEPVAVWGWHTAALTEIRDRLRARKLRVGMIIGATPQAERDRVIVAAQAGDLDVVVCQIIAAGTGITLTRIRRAIFLEQSFRNDDNVQAEDRHHRIGQTEPVQVERMVLENSIDSAVAAICARRAQVSDALLPRST